MKKKEKKNRTRKTIWSMVRIPTLFEANWNMCGANQIIEEKETGSNGLLQSK